MASELRIRISSCCKRNDQFWQDLHSAIIEEMRHCDLHLFLTLIGYTVPNNIDTAVLPFTLSVNTVTMWVKNIRSQETEAVTTTIENVITKVLENDNVNEMIEFLTIYERPKYFTSKM